MLLGITEFNNSQNCIITRLMHKLYFSLMAKNNLHFNVKKKKGIKNNLLTINNLSMTINNTNWMFKEPW